MASTVFDCQNRIRRIPVVFQGNPSSFFFAVLTREGIDCLFNGTFLIKGIRCDILLFQMVFSRIRIEKIVSFLDRIQIDIRMIAFDIRGIVGVIGHIACDIKQGNIFSVRHRVAGIVIDGRRDLALRKIELASDEIEVVQFLLVFLLESIEDFLCLIDVLIG